MNRILLIITLAFVPFESNALASSSPANASIEVNVTSLIDESKKAFKAKQLDKAQATLEIALKEIKNGADPKQRAEIKYWLGKVREGQAEASNIFSASRYGRLARDHYIGAVELAPKNTSYRLALIDFYIDAPTIAGGNVKEAKMHAEALFEQDKLLGFKALAKSYAKLDEHENVLLTYQRGLNAFPNDAELYYLRGHYYLSIKDYNSAVTNFLSSKNLPTTDSHQTAIQFHALYYIGRTSSISGQNLEQGIAAYEEYLDQYQHIAGHPLPDTNWVTYRMALLLEENKQSTQAKALYHSLLADPDLNDERLEAKIRKRL